MRLISHGLIAAYLCFACALRAQSPQSVSSPRQVVAQFCELDSEGMRFDREGSLRVEKLLSEHGVLKETPIVIIHDYAISKATTRGDEADLFVEYSVIGKIDEHFDFKPYMPELRGPIKIRVNYHLRREGDGQRVEASTFEPWRIEHVDMPPYVRSNYAIRYLLRVQNNAPIASNRRNAAKAIAILRGQEKP